MAYNNFHIFYLKSKNGNIYYFLIEIIYCITFEEALCMQWLTISTKVYWQTHVYHHQNLYSYNGYNSTSNVYYHNLDFWNVLTLVEEVFYEAW
jgi:hypothetical protein